MKRIKLEGGYLIRGDCVKVMRKMKAGSVDLIVGSPPYEAKRSYAELKFNKRGEEWVAWMVEVFLESLRVCKGLVAFVVGHGEMKNHKWSAVPALLTADLHRQGVNLFNPAIYMRNGIPGSGGNQWLRADYEWIICATSAPHGKLPYAANTACGAPPKYGPGGVMSNRTKSGKRASDGRRGNKLTSIGRHKDGTKKIPKNLRLGSRDETQSKGHNKTGDRWSVKKDGTLKYQSYKIPAIANPGNVIDCGAVGGGRMGSNIAHDNEAPMPNRLVEVFIRSFCPPGGLVLDPFVGSGTTIAEAIALDRRYAGVDVRQSQIDLCRRRVLQAIRRRGFGMDV